MKRKNHKWSKEEEDTIYECTKRFMSPADIKLFKFQFVYDITVQAIADKASRIVDEREQPNYGKPWSIQDATFLAANLDKSNSLLKPILGRGSKELDQAKWDIRHKGGINPKRREHLDKMKLTPINDGSLSDAALRVYDLIAEIKAVDPDIIEEIRQTRNKFKENPEPVQVYDYLKLPMGIDINPRSDIRKSMRSITKRVEELNKFTLDKPGKATTISTHQNNLLRQLFCLRVTSHRNLNIQPNVIELQNLTRAFVEHFDTTKYGMKMLPNNTPIKRRKK